MKTVTLLAVVDAEKCTGCTICNRVCPTLAIKTTNHLAAVEEARCSGCPACEQRCPEGAISIKVREKPFPIGVPVPPQDRARIDAICRKARFHPEQLVCYCTSARADEVVAAILQGAHTPEEISFRTGVRTGCTVECLQPHAPPARRRGHEADAAEGRMAVVRQDGHGLGDP